MLRWKSFLSLVLAICFIFSCIPVSVSAAESGWNYAQNGNTGALITYSSAIDSAVVNDPTLASAVVSGNTVTVIGVSGAVGVASVSVSAAGEMKVFEVPLGYTTFVFSGDSLTVYPGSDDKYEVTGVNPADEEYAEGDEAYPLVTATDENGNTVYYNSENYALYVSVSKKGGTYVFTGTGNDMAIAVKKEATNPATLLLCNLNLTSSFTSPITIKKNSTSTVTITTLAGMESTLTDVELNNADLYGDPTDDGGDGTNVEYAESAVIKGKDYANLTMNGNGTLNLNCATKNAVKIGEYGSLTLEDLTLNVTTARNGLSSDNILTIHSGTYNINSAADGIRSDPDVVGADIGCAGNIIIEDGKFQITSGSDCIQAAQDLTISDGTFNLKAGAGWDDAAFDKDTMSCKGLKASGNLDETDETAVATNMLTITGGYFSINTADDSIHSDCDITITGGQYEIDSGDDAVHADGKLILGTEGGPDCAVSMYIGHSYEGLEGAYVDIYSGCYDVVSSDDGINAAGDSTTEEGTFPGWPGGGNSGSTSYDYYINIHGGKITVNSEGDGLDANGPLNLLGGTVVVWGCTSGGNAALDCDGALTVNGATLLAASRGDMEPTPGSGSQNYITVKRQSFSAGDTISITSGGMSVFAVEAVKNVSYVLYSAPDMGSGCSISRDNSAAVTTNWVDHAYTVTETEPDCIHNGHTTYVCTLCGYSAEDTGSAALGHSFGEYVSDGNASCNLDGTETAVCHRCGGTNTRTVEGSKLSHEYESEVKEPTCTEEGGTVYTCKYCGDTYNADPIPAMGHSWDEGVVTRLPSESESGIITYTCMVCGETREEAIPATGYTECNVIRIAGADRCETALKLADYLKETLGGGKFDTILVASALNFPDALTGSYLANLKNAPILLTYHKAQTMVLDYIGKNLAEDGTVYILGGESAVDPSFDTGLEELGITGKRLAGPDRFATNLEILKEAGVDTTQEILICTGVGFADSLSASAAGLPIVLVHGSLSDAQKEVLNNSSRKFVIIGGPAAVSGALEAELKAIGSVERLGGKTRYETSVLVAESFAENPDAVVLAYAQNFPDGLCGGPLAVKLNAPLVLTDNYDPSAADSYVSGITSGVVIGGPTLISDAAAKAIFDLTADAQIKIL